MPVAIWQRGHCCGKEPKEGVDVHTRRSAATWSRRITSNRRLRALSPTECCPTLANRIVCLRSASASRRCQIGRARRDTGYVLLSNQTQDPSSLSLVFFSLFSLSYNRLRISAFFSTSHSFALSFHRIHLTPLPLIKSFGVMGCSCFFLLA